MLRLGNGISYGNPYNKIVFDPSRKTLSGLVCISHAHSDHARSHETRTLMTPETARITGLEAETLPYGKSVEYGEYTITPFSAGHIAGSAQFQVENGCTMVYTGDFKMEDSLLFDGAEALPCEELVIESTFGKPGYSFPPREEIYQDMADWIKFHHSHGRIILLGGYPTGKAQELTRLVNEYCGITPLVHPKVREVNDACVESGFKLGEYFEFSSPEGREIAKGPFVAILSPGMLSHSAEIATRLQYGRDVVSATATGWAGVFTSAKAFPLSDHADFQHLLEYVKRAEPKRVYTVHGYKKEFARYLRREGFNAKPLEKDSQSSLDGFP